MIIFTPSIMLLVVEYAKANLPCSDVLHEDRLRQSGRFR